MYATTTVDERVRYDAIELRVPHDPTALRRWLAEVTNAQPPTRDAGGVWP